MSKNVAMFIDVANMYYAARGQDVDIDYVALLKHATKGRDLIRAYAYTGLDPENENQRKFIDFLAKNGYKPVIKDIRKFGDGRMKANLDIELVVDLFRLADRMDIAVIASGDGDFAPAIKALQDKGVRCEVISFKPNTSSDLIAVADEFQDIMKIASISRKKGEGSREASTSMPTPEMPAKEVNPEFGFREASPSVAAAALAALKGGSAGTSTGNGRRTRGGTGRRTAAPAAAAEPALAEEAPERAVASPAETLAEGDEQARRRRRRRGGRGRGRSRREEEDGAELTPAAAGTEEVGWEEFDDLSQIDGVEDAREYTFEEADAATLAELGLSADDLQATPAEEEKPKRRSTRTSSRSRKAADADAAEGSEAAPAEEKPKRRSTRTSSRTSSRTKKAEAADDGEATEGSEAAPAEEEKPKRRSTRTASRTRKAADDAEAPSAEPKPRARRSTRSRPSEEQAPAPADSDEPQGIWGRFRSARKPRGAAE